MFRNPSRQPQPPRIIRRKRIIRYEDEQTRGPQILKVKSASSDPDLFSSLEIIPLGAGSEVGRSCILIKYKGKSILLDCGVHPGYTGLDSLPFFDRIDPKEIDILLISHFHLDHAAAVPYFLKNTSFKGKIFMTPPTKAIFQLLLSDFVRIS